MFRDLVCGPTTVGATARPNTFTAKHSCLVRPVSSMYALLHGGSATGPALVPVKSKNDTCFIRFIQKEIFENVITQPELKHVF